MSSTGDILVTNVWEEFLTFIGNKSLDLGNGHDSSQAEQTFLSIQKRYRSPVQRHTGREGHEDYGIEAEGMQTTQGRRLGLQGRTSSHQTELQKEVQDNRQTIPHK